MTAEPSSLQAAQAGDRRAFDALFGPQIPKLRGVLRRMVGHPEDVEDLTQQTLLRAFERLSGFRGDSNPGTWLCSIGARLAIDHLRRRKRWRLEAQTILAVRCMEPGQAHDDVMAAMSSPDYTFDVGEHIAYCFTCVGRTLQPEAQAALVLRDVLGLTNEEAAKALGWSKSVLRHRLTAGRSQMQTHFEGLCSLVNKQGVCWQCAGLREVSPEGRKGSQIPAHIDWPQRLAIVRDAALDRGSSQCIHDVFFRHTEEQEEAGHGDPNARSDCGRPDAAP